MRDVLSGQMSDQKIKIDIAALKGFVEATDGRTLRLGEKIEKLKDCVQTDISTRLSKIEGRTEVLMWIVGVTLSVYTALFIAGGVQLYLLNGRVSGLESDVRHIAGTVDAIRLKQLSNTPTAPGVVAEAQNILATAKAKKIPIDKEVIIDAGKTFIGASRNNPNVWKAAVAFVNYRSFLSEDDAPRTRSIEVSHLDWWTTVQGTIKKRTAGNSAYTLGGPLVPNDLAARYEAIGATDNNGHLTGPSLIVVDGNYQNQFWLDGYWLKNVVIRNASIKYSGGPVMLENVYFINCTFEITPTAPSQLFAESVLQSPSATFKQS